MDTSPTPLPLILIAPPTVRSAFNEIGSVTEPLTDVTLIAISPPHDDKLLNNGVAAAVAGARMVTLIPLVSTPVTATKLGNEMVSN